MTKVGGVWVHSVTGYNLPEIDVRIGFPRLHRAKHGYLLAGCALQGDRLELSGHFHQVDDLHYLAGFPREGLLLSGRELPPEHQ
jgi:hypothetical protein